MPNSKVLKPITNPEIHSIQTSIDARALNICGIFTPPVTRVAKVCTRMVLMSIGTETGLRGDDYLFCYSVAQDG